MFLQKFHLQNSPVFLFQATSVDRPGRPALCLDMHCLCMSVGRLDRSTDGEHSALGNFRSTGPVDRKKETVFPPFGSVDRTGRPGANGYFQLGWRSTGPVDRQACNKATALSSLGFSEKLFSFSALTDFWRVVGELLQVELGVKKMFLTYFQPYK